VRTSGRDPKVLGEKPESPGSVATHSIPLRGLQQIAQCQPFGGYGFVATHSIPIGGLQHSFLPFYFTLEFTGHLPLQRTQSPSGDCNNTHPVFL
jgi:hypothetical protein